MISHPAAGIKTENALIGNTDDQRIRNSDWLTANYFIQTIYNKSQLFIRCFCDLLADSLCGQNPDLTDLYP